MIFKVNEIWRVPMIKNGHVFVRWKKNQICYTHADYKRLHLNCFHPTGNRVFALIKMIKHEETGAEFLETIRRIAATSETRREFSKGRFTFRGTMLPETTRWRWIQSC